MKPITYMPALKDVNCESVWTSHDDSVEPSGGGCWRSYGGPTRNHPSRALPFSTEIPIPDIPGPISRVHLIGVFAMYVNPAESTLSTCGASLNIPYAGGGLFHIDLTKGRHYFDASNLTPICQANGDGTEITTVGQITIDDKVFRVDRLSLDVGPKTVEKRLRFTDLGTPASFVLCDVIFEYMEGAVCPFSSKGQGIALQDLAGIVRIGDRNRFAMCQEQFFDSLRHAEDLDEARGLALTFLAVIAAAQVELGASRKIHRFQLHAARELERAKDLRDVDRISDVLLSEIAGELIIPTGMSEPLITKALEIINRSYALNLSDEELSAQLGISTSHFRYLFRLNTGRPFHQYLLALRLEKARELLATRHISVSEVSQLVGFGSAAHFSRAFAKRFRVSPSSVKHSNR